MVVNTRGPSKTLSSQFLADFQEDYWKNGRGIFEWMRKHRPDKYFDASVYLAKVHKLELGAPGLYGTFGPVPVGWLPCLDPQRYLVAL
jgi:hypothetical protein